MLRLSSIGVSWLSLEVCELVITIRAGREGSDSNLPAIATIRAGREGSDSNLPAILFASVLHGAVLP